MNYEGMNMENQVTSQIDFQVESFRETEGPLGGISIEFRIVISTYMAQIRSVLKSTAPVIKGEVFKTFRECEDCFDRLKKKFPLLSSPQKIADTDPNERLKHLDKTFKALAHYPEVCSSPVLIHFLCNNITLLQVDQSHKFTPISQDDVLDECIPAAHSNAKMNISTLVMKASPTHMDPLILPCNEEKQEAVFQDVIVPNAERLFNRLDLSDENVTIDEDLLIPSSAITHTSPALDDELDQILGSSLQSEKPLHKPVIPAKRIAERKTPLPGSQAEYKDHDANEARFGLPENNALSMSGNDILNYIASEEHNMLAEEESTLFQ